MITDQNPTKVRCKNVWSNAPIGTGINPILEGVNVSSEIINIYNDYMAII